MPLPHTSIPDAVSRDERPDPLSAASAHVPFECYCGLGPACPAFRMMSPEERVECTRDKRRTAQQFYRNGMG
ncbi:MAG: hypothetical protein ACHQQ3_12015 [Gemmatimonadales bacterium]